MKRIVAALVGLLAISGCVKQLPKIAYVAVCINSDTHVRVPDLNCVTARTSEGHQLLPWEWWYIPVNSTLPAIGTKVHVGSQIVPEGPSVTYRQGGVPTSPQRAPA